MQHRLRTHPVSAEQIQQDDYIAGLAKGLGILEAFGTERQKLNVAQIASKTQISRTAVRRYLRTLKYLGYLRSDGDFFWLSHRVLRFSSAYLSSSFLPKLAQPYLNQLSQATGLVYSVAVLDDHEIVPIARSSLIGAEHMRVMPYGLHLGNRLPAHATSTGKLLLSYLKPQELSLWIEKFGLPRLTPYTLTTAEVFGQRLLQIAQQDFCLSQEEHELGVIAIAVPISNVQGQALAALNCIAQVGQIHALELVERILPLLRSTAQQLKAALA
jgi:IclR family pca regulon transcriptional regulator